jgi:16S rRNA processing protein RimM
MIGGIFLEDFLRIGIISSTHGIKGEVKVFPTTDDNNRFKELDGCYIVTKTGIQQVHVSSVKFFKNMVILGFKEFNNINEIEKYKGCDIVVSREDAVALDEGEFFICDILGAACYDQEDNLLGKTEDYLDTAANGVFVVKDEAGKETLIPVVKEWVDLVDTENKIVRVHLLDVMED